MNDSQLYWYARSHPQSHECSVRVSTLVREASQFPTNLTRVSFVQGSVDARSVQTGKITIMKLRVPKRVSASGHVGDMRDCRSMYIRETIVAATK
jgi:hypothetical protein